MTSTSSPLHALWLKIGRLGLQPNMSPYQYNQGVAFNYMNFAGLCMALLRLLYLLLFEGRHYPLPVLALNAMPAIGCMIMMGLMQRRAFAATVYFSFLVFPALLFFISYYTGDRGIAAYLLPYLIYPFFFMNRVWKIMLVFALPALLLALNLLLEQRNHGTHRPHSLPLEIISFAGAVVLTFISLFAIKKQVWHYQHKTSLQHEELEKRNIEIEAQKEKLIESNRIKDKVLSIIGHDLKAPFQGLQLLFNNIQDDRESAEMLAGILPDVRAELGKANDMFENLLNWARLQMREANVVMEQMNVADLAEQVTQQLSPQARRKEISLTTELSDTVIHADKHILEIVLRNLLSNAIKFTPENKNVAISGSLQNGAYLLQVADSGLGMTESILEKVKANGFYTSPGTNNEKGTGLGLMICRDLVEKCGGKLNIESSKDRGTLVSVLLPQLI